MQQIIGMSSERSAGVPSRTGLAKVMVEKKQFQEAADQLEKAARLFPKDETIYYNLMVAYRGLGRQQEARSP